MYAIRSYYVGQSFIYEILRKYELNDLVYQWLLSEQGVQSMLTDNSATLKEYFGDNQHGSCNHAMFSSYVSWFYQGLGGISVQDQAIGSDQIIIEPFFADTINYVECEHKTNHGQIYCKWYRFETHIELVISVPFNLKTCTLGRCPHPDDAQWRQPGQLDGCEKVDAAVEPPRLLLV